MQGLSGKFGGLVQQVDALKMKMALVENQMTEQKQLISGQLESFTKLVNSKEVSIEDQKIKRVNFKT